MESKLTKSSIMMIIGLFFVMLAGGIFVTTSWRNFSPTQREIALFCFMLIFFLGKIIVGKMFDLPKTESCMFYLGVVFASFLTYTIIYYSFFDNVVKALSISIFVAFLFCFIRFFISKKALDFIFSAIILNVFGITLTSDYGKNYNVMLIVWAVVLIVFALLYKFKEKIFDSNEGLNKVFKVVLSCQMIFVLVCILAIIYNALINWYVKDSWFLRLFIDGDRFVPMVFVLPVMIIALFIAVNLQDYTLNDSKSVSKKITNTFLLCLLGITIAVDINRIVKLNVVTVLFAILLGVAIWQIIKPNKYIMLVATVLSLILGYSQFYSYGKEVGEVHYSQYLPFLLLFGVVWLVEGCKKKDKGYIIVAIYQLAIESIKTAFIIFMDPFDRYDIANEPSWGFFYIAISIYAIATVTGQLKRVFYAIATGFVSVGLVFIMFIIDIPEGLGMEWFVASLLLPAFGITYIFRKDKTFVAVFQSIAIFFSTFLLFIDNVPFSPKNLLSALIFVAYLTILIIVGVAKEDKKNWITHLVVLFIYIIFVTEKFWLSFPWWAYFVIVGLVFIAVAIFLEKREKNKKGIEEQKTEEKIENK